MCYHPLTISRNVAGRVLKYNVPCGKCVDCLKKRQNSYFIRIYNDAIARGGFYFLTLTYDNNNLPLKLLYLLRDVESGELVEGDNLFPDVDAEIFRKDLVALSSSDFMLDFGVDVTNHFYHEVGLPSYFFDYFTPDSSCSKDFDSVRVIPTLRRRDVRLWIKSARVQYERIHGVKFPPDFKYICASEYGTNTGRPHYHILLFGLNREQIQFLVDRWKYGFVDIKRLDLLHNSTRDFERVARYISKYICKGSFERDEVKLNFVEKPRLLCSIGLGLSNLPVLRSEFRSGSHLEIYQRMIAGMDINGFKYAIPQFYKKYIYGDIFKYDHVRQVVHLVNNGRYITMPDGTKEYFKYDYKSTLQICLQALQARESAYIYESEFRKNLSDKTSRKDVAIAVNKTNNTIYPYKRSEFFTEKNLQKFYNKSKL